MIIDIRIDEPEFEEQFEQLKHIYGEKTNTKAVKTIVLHHNSLLNSEKHWKERALESEAKLEAIKNGAELFKSLLYGDGLDSVVSTSKKATNFTSHNM